MVLKSGLGQVLRELREKKGLTQEDLAERAEISQAYVTSLETGAKKNPSLDILKRVAKALKVKVGELLE